MIPFCAKQGVERKISFRDFLSAMLSDYECAYACGLAARKLGIQVDGEILLSEVKEMVEAAMKKALPPQDDREKNLYQLIQDYTLRGFEEVSEGNPATQSEIPILIEMGLKSTYLD